MKTFTQFESYRLISVLEQVLQGKEHQDLWELEQRDFEHVFENGTELRIQARILQKDPSKALEHQDFILEGQLITTEGKEDIPFPSIEEGYGKVFDIYAHHSEGSERKILENFAETLHGWSPEEIEDPSGSRPCSCGSAPIAWVPAACCQGCGSSFCFSCAVQEILYFGYGSI